MPRERSNSRCDSRNVLKSAVEANSRDGVDSQPEGSGVGCHIQEIERNGGIPLSIGVLSQYLD